MESQRSAGRRDFQARRPKSTAAKGIKGRGGVVAQAAGLEEEIVARRQQPHPVPRHAGPHPQARAHAEEQPGQKQEGNEIDEEEPAVGSGEEQQRSRQPFQAAGPVVHAPVWGMDPVPTPLGQPMQYPGHTAAQPLVRGGRVECGPEQNQKRQPGKAGRQPPPEPRPDFAAACKPTPAQSNPSACAPAKAKRPPRRRRRRIPPGSIGPGQTAATPQRSRGLKPKSRF